MFSQLFIIITLDECQLDKPILSNGECSSQCQNKEYYKSGECSINNTIIKTQFPNDIISIGEETFRYLNFITLSNGEMIFQTFSYPENNRRIFYGLKNNGRGYFKNSNKETPFFSVKANNTEQFKYESGNSIFTINGKEYFLSMGRLKSYTEIIDLENGTIISNKTNNLIGFDNYNFASNLIKINKDTNEYLFSGLYLNSEFYSIIMKLTLTYNLNSLIAEIIKFADPLPSFEEIGSCIMTEKNEKIICFYGKSERNDYLYYILAYDMELKLLGSEEYRDNNIKKGNYFYCKLFKENIGVFIYYKFETNNYYFQF